MIYRTKKLNQPMLVAQLMVSIILPNIYVDLLSKKSKERVHDQNTEAVFEVHFDIGFN